MALNETNVSTDHDYYYDTSGEQDGGGMPAHISYICTMLLCLVFCVGVVGNTLVVLVVATTKEMRTSTNYFLVNLSVADILVLVICMPTALMEIYSETWLLGSIMCYLVPFLENTVYNGSAMTILAISSERYLAICQPLMAQYTLTAGRTVRLVVVIWLVAAASGGGFGAMTHYQTYYMGLDDATTLNDTLNTTLNTTLTTTTTAVVNHACGTQIQKTWEKIYLVSMVTLFFIIPSVVLLILYIAIYRSLMGASEITLSTSGPTAMAALKARKQVVLMLAFVVMFFFVCLTPFRVFSVYLTFADYEDYSHLTDAEYYSLLYFCRVMTYMNSAVNPVLYNIVSTKFRHGFLYLLSCRQVRMSRHRPAYGATPSTASAGVRRHHGNGEEPTSVWSEHENCSKVKNNVSTLDVEMAELMAEAAKNGAPHSPGHPRYD